MARYVLGDIQGCFESLQALLERIDFDPRGDRLVLAGDLVNRGPRSLDVLRWVARQRDRVDFVLGNHDLHLLVLAAGLGEHRGRDSLRDVLAAPDRDALLELLAGAPLLHREPEALVVHAGLLPAWSAARAEALGAEVCAALADPTLRAEVLDAVRRPRADEAAWRPRLWSDALEGRERTALVVAALTRLRVCDARGGLVDGFTGAPDQAPAGATPWFAAPHRRSADTPIVFGHWAALGLHRGDNVTGLDTGCVWGGALTALRLDDQAVFTQPAVERAITP